jgi:cobalt-zinc-cadmium efflux system outer membrane protein
MINKTVFLLCCVFAMTASAQEPIAQDSLTLDQAIIQVLENNPVLKVADYEAQALAARMRGAIQPPADRVSMTLENFAGTGETVALRGVEATLSLSRTLERGNKADRRGDVVEGEAQLLLTRKDLDRLNLLADTAQQFLHVATDQERLRLVERAIELVKMTETTVRQGIASGKTAEVELQRVIIDLANHELELEHIRHELETSRVQLSTLWGDRHAGFAGVAADIFQIDALPDFAELTTQLDQNPEITRHLKAEDIARARIRLMQSRTMPDIEVTAGLRYLGGSNDVAAMLWASIPLGSAARAQAGIEEAESMAQIEPLNLEKQRLDLYATLFQIYQEMKHSREAVGVLNETIIPAATKMLADYEGGYKLGRYSLQELIQVQQLLHTARSRLLEMASAFHSHKIEIDRLTGAQLTQW